MVNGVEWHPIHRAINVKITLEYGLKQRPRQTRGVLGEP